MGYEPTQAKVWLEWGTRLIARSSWGLRLRSAAAGLFCPLKPKSGLHGARVSELVDGFRGCVDGLDDAANLLGRGAATGDACRDSTAQVHEGFHDLGRTAAADLVAGFLEALEELVDAGFVLFEEGDSVGWDGIGLLVVVRDGGRGEAFFLEQGEGGIDDAGRGSVPARQPLLHGLDELVAV